MISRRATFVTAIVGTAATCFSLGAIQNHRAEASAYASYDTRLTTLQDELRDVLIKDKADHEKAVGTVGAAADTTTVAKRERLVDDIKEQIRHEMGLLP